MAVFRLLLTLAIIALPFTAQAVTCTLDVEQAYEAASARGWKFMCMKGVLSFDRQKRPGCVIKPVVPGAWEEGRFLSNTGYLENDNGGRLKNDWRVDTFEMSGGEWTHGSGRGTESARVHFTFSAPVGKYTRRYLTYLRVSRPGKGFCTNVYDQAF